MSKIVAEIEVKQGRISDAAKGVAKKIEGAFAPLKRTQIAGSMLASSFRPMTQVIAGVASGLAMVGGAGVAAGAGIAFGVKRALDMGGALSDMSAQTGIAAGALMVMQQAFANNGVPAEKIGASVNKLQKSMDEARQGVTEFKEPFDRLGISMAEMDGLSPDQQFRRTAAAISGLSDPTARAAIAMQIFGKSGAELQALFNDKNAFGDAAAQVGTQAALMNRNAALFDDISDKLALAGLKVQGFFVGVADQVAPVLQPLLDWFASQDLAAQGQKFGMYVAAAITMITDGSLGGMLNDMMLKATITFANGIREAVNQILELQNRTFGVDLGLGNRLSPIDSSGVDARIAQHVSTAINKVFDARQTADKNFSGPGRDRSQQPGEAAGAGGSKVSLSRLFATSAGLFVKDPLLAENRRQTGLLEKINTGIQNLKLGTPAPAAAGGNRFT